MFDVIRTIWSVCAPLALALLTASGAQAATFSVLYTFTGGNDGANSTAGLIADQNGDLYGTTSAGGTYGYGTVFQLAPD